MKRRQKTEFGEFLVEEIKKIGISQEEFYTAVGIKKPYFYDLLTAAPPPPDLQNKMLTVIETYSGNDAERRKKLYDLAARGRNEIPSDITDFIVEHQDDIATIRSALSSLFSPQH